jgi:hypothetical protein
MKAAIAHYKESNFVGVNVSQSNLHAAHDICELFLRSPFRSVQDLRTQSKKKSSSPFFKTLVLLCDTKLRLLNSFPLRLDLNHPFQLAMNGSSKNDVSLAVAQLLSDQVSNITKTIMTKAKNLSKPSSFHNVVQHVTKDKMQQRFLCTCLETIAFHVLLHGVDDDMKSFVQYLRKITKK